MFTKEPVTVPQNVPELLPEYDVIIIGAGPSGSTVGALLSEAGHKVAILDRTPYPRFQVGESLVPETYWSLKRLGVLEYLSNSACPKKFSVQFVTETGKETAPFYFDEYKDSPSSQTWQVVRSEFDLMLLENARSQGATVHTRAHVLEVLFDGDTATGVRVQLTDDAGEQCTTEIRAKVVVDASGLTSFLASRLELKQIDPHLRKGAIWSYFKGAHRDTGRDEGATIILQTGEKKSWFWYIPLQDDIVSVGCTGDLQYLFNDKNLSPEEIFNREVERCPGMQRRLASAQRAADVFVTKDYSYTTTRAAGAGWLLVGDAFGFVDPVYSSGVFLALKSGELAADAIINAFEQNNFSAENLGEWQADYVAGIGLVKKMVYAFYTPGFSFGDFLKDHPQYRSNLVDILIGDIFKPGVGEIFDAMGEVAPPVHPAV